MIRGDAYDVVCTACARYFASIQSSFRSAQHNENVGGHVFSKHTTGEAWDLWFDVLADVGEITQRRNDCADYLEDRGLFIHKYPENHRRLHVQSVQKRGV